MALRLTKNSPAVKLLRRKLITGRLSGEDDPKAVWESEPIFQAHKLANFRTCYNNLRREVQNASENAASDIDLEIEEDCDIDELNTQSSKPLRSQREKKRRLYTTPTTPGEAEGDVHAVETEFANKALCDLTFKPLYLLAVWNEPVTMVKSVTLAIVLPSGVGSGDFSIRVVEDGQYIELCVMWPSSLLNIELMTRKSADAPRDEKADLERSLRMNAFETTLKELRENNSQDIQSKALIRMPFAVQSRFDNKKNRAFPDESKMILIHLKAHHVEEYGISNDDDEFETVDDN